MTPRNETGAPAALRAIEEHELRCRNEKDTAHKCWQERLRLLVVGDDVSERDERLSHSRYLEALELWDDSTKKLAVFDKGVRPERREGEKILVVECKEMFAQLFLSLNVALESYIISIAQNAYQCNSAEEFFQMHADNLRATRDTAIESAKRECVLPEWVLQ